MLLRFLFNLFRFSESSRRRQQVRQDMKTQLLLQQETARLRGAQSFLLERDLRNDKPEPPQNSAH